MPKDHFEGDVRAQITVTEVVPFNKADHYETIRKWWEFYYDGDLLPAVCLPDSGAVVMFRGKPAAVSFLYKTNAKIAQIHFTMANPDLGPGRRVFFLDKVVAAVIEMAKEFLDGQGFIWTVTDHATVGRVYQRAGLTCVGEADAFFLPAGDEDCEFLK